MATHRSRRTRRHLGLVAVLALVVGGSALAAPPAAAALTDAYVLDTTWGGTGTGDGQFDGAGGLAVDPRTGDVLVVDRGNDRVQVFDAEGTYLAQFGATGTGDAQFTGPTDITYWPFTEGWVVTDTGNDRVSVWNDIGDFDRHYGSTGTGDGEFQSPHSVAAGGNLGLLHVTDEGNDRVQAFTYGPNTAAAYFFDYGSSGTGDGQFDAPQGIGLDGSGGPLVADSGNDRLQSFSMTGTFVSTAGTAGTAAGQIDGPRGVAVDPNNGDVAVVDATTARFQTFQNTSFSFLGATSLGSQPFDVAVGPDGSVYVTRGDLIERWVPAPRPDALLRVGSGAFVGNDTFNTTGAGQSRSRNVGNLGTATFTVRAQNDRPAADDLRVRGQGSTNRFTVTYRRSGVNITNQVVAGTFALDGVAAGANRDIVVTIRALPGTPRNTTISRTVTVRSHTDGTIRDTVKATVKRV